MEKIILRNSMFKALKLVVLPAVFVGLGIWIIISRSGREWAGWLNVVFFGLCLAVGLYQLFDRRPQLTADAGGLYARMALNAAVPWASITHMRLYWTGVFFARQAVLEITLSPAAGTSAIKKRWFTPKSQLAGHRVAIMLSPLKGRAKDIFAQLQELAGASSTDLKGF